MEKLMREPRATYIMIISVAVSAVIYPLIILDHGESVDTFSIVCASLCFVMAIFVIALLVRRLKRRVW